LITICEISVQSSIDPSEDALHQSALAHRTSKWIAQVVIECGISDDPNSNT